MKTTIRFQSQLLVRRSYKPPRVIRRPLNVAFRPTRRFAVPVSECGRNGEKPASVTPDAIALSG